MTGRSLPEAIAYGVKGAEVRAFWAVDLLFDSPNQIYMWSGLGDLSLGGNTYTGVGDLLQISEMQESSDIAAYGATLTLSGIPTSTVDLALAEPYQGRKALVKFGIRGGPSGPLLTEAGEAILTEAGELLLIEDAITTGMTIFSGEMDQMVINYGPETVSISLAVESRLVNLRNPRIRRYTDEDHQARYPGDVAFGFVTRLQNESLEWKG